MLELRYFAHSDRGQVRPENQDTAYAGTRLLAVADGGGPAGAHASSAAVEALKFLDTEEVPAGNVVVRATFTGLAPQTSAVAVTAGQTITKDFSLTRGDSGTAFRCSFSSSCRWRRC